MEYLSWVTLGTAIFELGAAAWILTGPGARSIRIPAGLITLFLGTYQALEWAVCGDPSAETLARLAWVTISFLPPLGVLLVVGLAQPKSALPKALAYGHLAIASAAAAIMYAVPVMHSGPVCEVIWARYDFDKQSVATVFYGVVYYLGMMAMVFAAAWVQGWLKDDVRRAMLARAQIGFLAFLLPAMIMLLTVPASSGAQASVLCHWAIFLAIFLVRMMRLVRQERGATQSSGARMEKA
ncbi:MAG: hypothetical protein JXX28_09265 [Deltaproteobacteria bacterium]|nr:hypothetical protein [Deltaproteobacteria bacterium]